MIKFMIKYWGISFIIILITIFVIAKQWAFLPYPCIGFLIGYFLK